MGNFYYTTTTTTTTLAALHCDPKFLEATTTVLVNSDINLSKVPKHGMQENLISIRKTFADVFTPIGKQIMSSRNLFYPTTF